MANNCLITKLKSVVENDTLDKLGELKVGCSNSNVAAQLKLVFDSTITFSLRTENAYIYNYYGTGYYNDILNCRSVTLTANDIMFSISGDGTLFIKDDYKLKEVILNNVKFSFDLLQIIARTSLTILKISNTRLHGNVEDLGKLINLTRLEIVSCVIDSPFNINAFSNCTQLTTAFLGNNAFGTVESLAEGFLNAGKTSSITFSVNFSAVTFKGNTHSNLGGYTISFPSSDSISVVYEETSLTLTATYSNGVWTYDF